MGCGCKNKAKQSSNKANRNINPVINRNVSTPIVHPQSTSPANLNTTPASTNIDKRKTQAIRRNAISRSFGK